MKYAALILFVVTLFQTISKAQEAGNLFNEANAAFKNGNFDQAILKYEKLIQEGYRSPELHYNLGNAYYRANRLGKAILHFERAAILNPGDSDIRHNLALSRQQVKNNLKPLPEFFLLRWWKNLRLMASSSGWGTASLVLWWAGFCGFGVWLLGKTRKQKKRGFLGGAACLFLSLLPFALALDRKAFEKNSRQAIVLEESVSLRSAPDEAGTELQKIYEGFSVGLLDSIGDSYKVRLPDGETGWVKMDDVEQI